jgi:XTP/dITP diphosphohydrolase
LTVGQRSRARTASRAAAATPAAPPQRSGPPAAPAAAASAAPTRLLVATRSPHKLAELRDLLRLARAELVDLDDAGIADEVEETGSTFAANAALKARFYARRSGLPTLADDSGLEVDALDGGPGVHTRRYAGERATDADNNAKLLAALAGLPPERRGARYRCVLALALPALAGPRGGLAVTLARGTLEGRIGTAPRGANGFGYDPIFEPAGEPPGGATVAEWPPERKQAVSHRARAARRMAPTLAREGF